MPHKEKISDSYDKCEYQAVIKSIYKVQFLVYDSYLGVCDRINTNVNVRFQISPPVNEEKSGYNSMTRNR